MEYDSLSVPETRVVLELRPSATQAGHGMDHTPGAIGFPQPVVLCRSASIAKDWWAYSWSIMYVRH